jgi:hypothetical protein
MKRIRVWRQGSLYGRWQSGQISAKARWRPASIWGTIEGAGPTQRLLIAFLAAGRAAQSLIEVDVRDEWW